MHPRYKDVDAAITALCEGEDDIITLMATVACELHHAFEHFNWTGFYRVTSPGMLKIGPYQGGHGCLKIPFNRGVCGAAAREERTQLVADVDSFPGHIACATSTQSEIVVPVFNAQNDLIAVLDIDSDTPDAFDHTDQKALESICERIFGTQG